MTLLLPIMTLILVVTGAFLLFMAMEQDRQSRAKFNRQPDGSPALLQGFPHLQADHAGPTE